MKLLLSNNDSLESSSSMVPQHPPDLFFNSMKPCTNKHTDWIFCRPSADGLIRTILYRFYESTLILETIHGWSNERYQSRLKIVQGLSTKVCIWLYTVEEKI